jgi:hypothetical protein
MTRQSNSNGSFAAACFILAGIFFILFPAVRPFFDESSLQGAEMFASARWVIAHVLGMAGFILLALGLLGLYAYLRQTKVERRTFLALVFSWIGAGLTLPFFGAEAFGIQVIGRAAADRSSSAILEMVDSLRFGPGLILILSGLLAVAVATIILATAVWSSGMKPRWAAVPLAAGFAVYIPQLQGAPVFQPIRLAVALVIALGCVLTALAALGHGPGEH